MGSFDTRIGVSDGNGGATRWLEAFVDTGATFTVLPADVLRDLGVAPRETREFTLADGRRANLPVGTVWIEAEGREGYSPVVFGRHGLYILGATTLQVLGLIPDTTNHRLLAAPGRLCI